MSVPKKPKISLESPGPSHRILIVGRTGSGKSVAGMFHLSRAPFDQMPYIIIDSKEEAAFRSIRGAFELDVEADPPKRPGIYIVRHTIADKEALDTLFSKIHAQGNTGLFIDEGYMVAPSRPRSAPFVSILTQGRTRRLPVIINSQRPAWIERFAISEASFFQVFDLTDDDDRKALQRFIPKKNVDLLSEFGQYRSVYHDVGRNLTVTVDPLRPADASIELIDKRLDALNRTSNTVRLRKI